MTSPAIRPIAAAAHRSDVLTAQLLTSRVNTASLPPIPATANTWPLQVSVPLPMSPHKSSIVARCNIYKGEPRGFADEDKNRSPLLPELCAKERFAIPAGSTARLIKRPRCAGDKIPRAQPVGRRGFIFLPEHTACSH